MFFKTLLREIKELVYSIAKHIIHIILKKHMSHFSYSCKMRYPLNLVLENWEYLWSYLTFCIVILDYVSISFRFIPLSYFRND